MSALNPPGSPDDHTRQIPAYGQVPPALVPPRKSRRTLWIVLGVISGLLVLCCGGITAIGFFAPAQKAAVKSSASVYPASRLAKQPAPPASALPKANHTASTATPPTTPKVAAPALSGFGATSDEWAANHVKDPDFPQGSTYDRDTSVPHVGVYPGARYVEVKYVGMERIGSYQKNFADGGVSQAEALASVRSDLPVDVRVVWQRAKDGNCLQTEYQSPTLAAAGISLDPQGMVLVELHSLANGGAYLSGKVAYALVSSDAAAAPDDVTGC